MRFRVVTGLFVLSMLAMSTEAAAQAVDVGINGVGVLSLQSTDDTFQSPYLGEPIGGLAPGFGAGVSVIGEGGFAMVGEITTARFELEQRGRVIPGNCIRIPQSSECSATTRLHDSLLSGLIGYARSAGRTRTLFLAGLSTVLDSATTNGASIHLDDSSRHRLAYTGGLGVLVALSPRVAIDAGARLTFADRSEEEIGIGAGSLIFRVLGGVRVRLN
jgi:opacity protein-like surface antigen